MQTALSPVQRKGLIEVLRRRLPRLGDAALIELERLTRKPDRLPGFVPRPAGVRPRPRSRPADGLPRPRAGAQGESAGRLVTRRELLTYSLAGSFAVLGSLAGSGWWQARGELEEWCTLFDRLEMHDLDQVVLDAVREVGPHVERVTTLTDDAGRQVEYCGAVLSDYRALLLQTQQSVLELESVAGELHRSCILLDETGFNVPTLVQELLGLASNIPGVRDYLDPLNSAMEVVRIAPSVAEAATDCVGCLQAWFSSEPGQGVDARLLEPLGEVLFVRVDEARAEAERLQEVWERDLVGHAQQVVEEREWIRREIARLR